MAKRTSDLFPAIIGGAVILLAIFFHSIYEDLLKAAVLKRLGAFVELPEAELVSRLAEMAVPIVGAVAVAWILLWYARREFRAGTPDPMVEAQRQTTAAILARTEAWKGIGPADIKEQDMGARNTNPATIQGEDWQLAEYAVENFAGVHLIGERNKWREMFQESYLAGHEAQDKIISLRNAMGGIFGVDSEAQLEASRRKLEVSAMQYDMAKDELKRAWDALRDDIELKLANGTLIAKGFRYPHASGNVEVAIASAEWRVLTLNNAKSEALRKGSGDVLYSGLLIGKSR
jgi:hypothetical protein